MIRIIADKTRRKKRTSSRTLLFHLSLHVVGFPPQSPGAFPRGDKSKANIIFSFFFRGSYPSLRSSLYLSFTETFRLYFRSLVSRNVLMGDVDALAVGEGTETERAALTRKRSFHLPIIYCTRRSILLSQFVRNRSEQTRIESAGSFPK